MALCLTRSLLVANNVEIACSRCSANLCPVDSGCIKRVWYPYEDFCRSKEHAPGVGWVKAQRKLQRRVGHLGLGAGYFTMVMLSVPCVVGRGMRGLNPDKDEPAQLARWMAHHPPRTPLTKARKEALAAQIAAAREKRGS